MRRFVAALFAALLVLGNSASEPPRTEWGDPDLTGSWPVQMVWDAQIRLERPEGLAGGLELSDEEFAARVARAEQSDGEYTAAEGGTKGLAAWMRSTPFARRSAQIVDPPHGHLPPLTEKGMALFEAGRSTRMGGLVFDWVSDFDAFERCITRGFPAVMLPQPYNNGMRIFQAPGYVALQMETFGTRIIPLGEGAHWPASVRAWHGDSRGHWEGSTLVIETTNIVTGDSVSGDPKARAAGPLPGRENAVMPVGPDAKVVERIALAGKDRLTYRVTYDDPAMFSAPWTAEIERQRDEDYQLFEYACQEGDSSIRAVIAGSRAERAASD